jgi:hypothetical protein
MMGIMSHYNSHCAMSEDVLFSIGRFPECGRGFLFLMADNIRQDPEVPGNVFIMGCPDMDTVFL